MHLRSVWIALSLVITLGGITLRDADARIVVGVSTVNVAFLPIYLTQDKGSSKTRAWTCSSSCSTPERPIFRR
jgi:hypothetical protein